MRKKLFLYNIFVLVFTLSIVTFLFMKIVNKEYEGNLKQSLKRNSILVSNLLNFNDSSNSINIIKEEFKNCDFRVTYINKNGVVLYDNDIDSKKLDNHNKRPEVIEARKNGEGYSIRYSNSLKKNIIYYAYIRNDGTIIRSAMEISYVNSFKRIYLKYYIAVVAVSGIFAMLLSFKLSKIIIEPIKDLKFITSAISKGELQGRVKISSNDEIGDLGKTFNDMADKLQTAFMDSVEKQNKLEAILESMDSGVIAVDRKNNVIMINPYAEKIFGVEKNIIGLKLMDNIRNYDLENIFREKSKKPRELKIVWPTERILRFKTADIINGYEYIGIVAVFQDITDIKKLENMRTQFVANVSHELKTPLTSIKGFAETIRYVDNDKERNEFLDIIDSEADRLTRLIGDILVLSDIEINTDMKKEEIDVEASIMEVYNLLKNTANKKNIEIKVHLEKGPSIMGDHDKFKQIIINLADNAIKYSENNDKVFIGSKYEGNNCIIWIEDTGAGIPEKDIPRLFETFYRVDKARSRAKGGTGLGLAIVKHIVMNFKGTIKVESKLNHGSKFIVTLPIA